MSATKVLDQSYFSFIDYSISETTSLTANHCSTVPQRYCETTRMQIGKLISAHLYVMPPVFIYSFLSK